MSGTIEAAPEARIIGDALFLVWGPPSHGPRSQVFARELGIEIRFVTSFRRRGPIVAPFKYLSMAAKTVLLLATRRPRVVFVQSPPSIAVATVWAYAVLTGARFFIDTHSATMLSSYWTRPAWLHRLITRRAAATIVTNQHFARRIREQGGSALVIPDIPTAFRIGEPFEVEGEFTIMVVNSFARDEPLHAIVAAARELPGVVFYVTGDRSRAGADIPRSLPTNVRLTGFLPDPTYYALMDSCHAVMCLTTRDHTMQRGACEALWMSTPIVTSRWPLLQEYFSAGTVHVGGTAAQIRDGIERMVREYEWYRLEIRRLGAERRRGWRDATASLVSLVETPARDPATAVRRRARRSG